MLSRPVSWIPAPVADTRFPAGRAFPRIYHATRTYVTYQNELTNERLWILNARFFPMSSTESDDLALQSAVRDLQSI
jgi:hypothetical protein